MQIFKQSKKVITSGVVGVSAFALVAAPGAAFAHGSSSGSQGNARQTASAQRSHDDPANHDQNDDRRLRQQGNATPQLLPCDQQQDALNKKASEAQAKYQKRLTGLNIMYSGIQTYVASGEVNVEDYEQLNATVMADQKAATDAVNAIAAPQLNCVNGTADGNSLRSQDASLHNSLNESIKNARQAVYTYQKDVYKLFQAVVNS